MGTKRIGKQSVLKTDAREGCRFESIPYPPLWSKCELVSGFFAKEMPARVGGSNPSYSSCFDSLRGQGASLKTKRSQFNSESKHQRLVGEWSIPSVCRAESARTRSFESSLTDQYLSSL